MPNFIYWCPSPKRKSWVPNKDSLHRTIKETFGSFPVELTCEHLETLEAMRRAAPHGPWGELIDAIHLYDAILVGA